MHSRFCCFGSCHSAPVIEDFSGTNHQFLTPVSRRAKRSIMSPIPRPTRIFSTCATRNFMYLVRGPWINTTYSLLLVRKNAFYSLDFAVYSSGRTVSSSHAICDVPRNHWLSLHDMPIIYQQNYVIGKSSLHKCYLSGFLYKITLPNRQCPDKIR